MDPTFLHITCLAAPDHNLILSRQCAQMGSRRQTAHYPPPLLILVLYIAWPPAGYMLPGQLLIHPGSRKFAQKTPNSPQICKEENVRGYPSIRAYQSGSPSPVQYNGWGQLNDLKSWTLPFIPSDVTTLNPRQFVDTVLTGAKAWLISFYTPGCGPCQK